MTKGTESGKGLAARSLTIGYEKDLIADICLSVTPGKIVTLIGPNGSGKSTLLKTITGRIKERGGVILLDGADKAGMSGREIASRLSMVMTDNVKPELMTCREVVETGRYPYTGLWGKLSAEDHRIVEDAMALTETLPLADDLFTKISDGQRQRVLLARSVCQEPAVLVLDEPTSYLDIRYKVDILTRIRRLTKERGIAVLMSLHEPELAMKLSDTVVAIGEGQILRVGTPGQVFEESFIRRLYALGSAPLDLLTHAPWFSEGKTVQAPVLTPENEGEPSKAKGTFARGVIMVQGTMSNVGKSVLAAALCRIFTKDGYRVAPFKSQNMALNSFVTQDGLEMGRAQVMQAECCGIAPSVYMNPILLKPTDDCGSQVIVNGKPIGNMPAKEYFAYKTKLIPEIQKAYDILRENADIIVVEGAGSPAEINLKENDIVNMGLARMIDAPVLLVGDIDRGGVFAQLLGTLDLLEEEERRRVCGLIVNKFRGDGKLLEPGIRMLEEKGGCKVAGVVPYFQLHLDDEDSLSERFMQKAQKTFDIAVIRLPHISNFTDFDVFEQFADVSVRYVETLSELCKPDAIILPGTKNTTGDLRWLKEAGFGTVLSKEAREGTVLFGICGGYQMLGRIVSDPLMLEGGGSEEGLGLLPVDTVLEEEKTRKQVTGSVVSAEGVLAHLAGLAYEGYEIHMGHSDPFDTATPFTEGGTGYCKENVYGTYVHGFFDKKEIAAGLIDCIAKVRGKDVDVTGAADYDTYKEMQYDKLADIVRESLDMPRIYQMMGMTDDKR
ncbi:MAG: cobyric acid synthase [Lachnospiraceae bacterium]|nr:cobyric acid synthase [Lachnospiraceae bacterium]